MSDYFDFDEDFTYAEPIYVDHVPADPEDTATAVVTGTVVAIHTEAAVPALPTDPICGGWTLTDYAGVGITLGSAEKLADSGIAPLVAAARPYVQVEPDTLTQAVKTWHLPAKTSAQGKRVVTAATTRGLMLMPWYSIDDLRLCAKAGAPLRHSITQFRPVVPEINPKDGKPRKYEFAAGGATPIAAHPAVPWEWIDEKPIILLAEGLLKGDSALTAMLLDAGVKREELAWTGGTTEQAQERLRNLLKRIEDRSQIVILTIAGVWNWRSNPEWASLRLNNRTVMIGVDGDVATNPQVHSAAGLLWEYLEKRSAGVCLLAPTSGSGEGSEKVGIDDYLAKHGSWIDLLAMETDNLPKRPDGALLSGQPGTNIVRADRETCTTRRHKVVAHMDPVTGQAVPAEIVTDVLGATIEIVGEEVITEGYGDTHRVIVKQDLRVAQPGKDPVIVKGWPDEALGDIEGILRQGGATHIDWFESDTPSLRADIKAAIRATIAPDYKPLFAMERTGYTLLPEGHEPAPADRDEADMLLDSLNRPRTNRVLVWVDEHGAIGPEWLEDPNARAEMGEGFGARIPIPDWAPAREVAEDVRTFLTKVMGIYNDPTLRYLHMAKYGWSLAGGKGGGALYVWAEHGSGKSKEGLFTNSMLFMPAEPFSCVNDTANYLPSLPDSRTNTVVVAGDVKRMPGDDHTWPALARTTGTFMRRDYDGPGASRGRNAGADAKFKAAKRNPAYPGIILDGELQPYFDASTMQKSMTFGADKHYAKPGQVLAVLEPLAADGLGARLSRSYIADMCGRLPRLLGMRKIEMSLDGIAAYWDKEITEFIRTGRSIAWQGNGLSEDRVAKAKTWAPRTQEVLTSYLLGHAMLSRWMLRVAEKGAREDKALVGLVDHYREEGAKAIFAAMEKHLEMCNSEGTLTKAEQVFEAIGIALASGNAYVDGDGRPVDGKFSVLIGKRYDEEHTDLLLSEVVKVTGMSDADVRAAFKTRGIKSGETYQHKVSINGARPYCYRIPTEAFRGSGKATSLREHADYLRGKIEHLQAMLAETEAQIAEQDAIEAERAARVTDLDGRRNAA